MRAALQGLALGLVAIVTAIAAHAAAPTYYDITRGAGPHDVAPAPGANGPVYYTGQRSGVLGILDPRTRKVVDVPLGRGSAPHGVIVGPDHAAWVTDGGRNAI